MQDSVEVPEPPATAVGLTLQLIPVVGEVESVKFTVPANPLAELTVIVEVTAEPTFPARLVGFALTAKSCIANVALVECETVPLVPVMVRMYVPAAVELHETDAVADDVMLAGDIGTQFRPEGTESVKVTVPVKPLRGLTAIVEVAGMLASTGLGEVAVMLKSVTMMLAVVECEREPLVAITLKL